MERSVGVDLGIRTQHRAAVFDGPVPRGKPFAFEVSRAGLEKLLHRATEGAEGPVSFVLEPTGLAWVPVAAYVMDKGHRVYLAKPQKASDLRKFLRKHVKSDSVDAAALGRLRHVDPYGMYELRLPTAQQMTLRRLVKRHDRLKSQVADQKRRVHALMVMLNPSLMAALGEEKFGKAAVAFFRRYADPEAVIRGGPAKLRKFWSRHSRGKARPERVERVYKACRLTAELYRDLRRAGRLPFDYKEMQEDLRAELDWMERAEEQARAIEEKIQLLYHHLDPEHTLEQLRGVGPVIAAAVEALVGSVERFANGRRFVSYSGLCPRKRQTGNTDLPMPITKMGQPLLRKYLYLAADVARQWDPDFAAYYARRYARGDHHNRIVIALARKMALRIYALLKRREKARRRASEGSSSQPVRYVLRCPDGQELDKAEARNLILERYARSVVAPERSHKDRTRKAKTEAVAPAMVEWPSADATSGRARPPSSPQIPRPGARCNNTGRTRKAKAS